MNRDTCRMPTCDRAPGTADAGDAVYRESRFCSPKCEVKFDHLKADAADARRAERQ
jgi:hypothetical protein